jgi:glycogen operon protein
MDYKACGYPDFSYHGSEAWRPDLSGYSHTIGMLYCGLYNDSNADHSFVYVAYNMHWEEREFALPALPTGCSWELVMNTADDFITVDEHESVPLTQTNKYLLEARSICMFVSKGEPSKIVRKDRISI